MQMEVILMLKTLYTWLVGGRCLQYYYHFNSMSLSRKKLREIWSVLVRVFIYGVCVYVCVYIIITRISQIYIFYEHWTLYRKFFLRKKKKNIPYKILSLKEKRLYLFSHVFSSRFIPPYPVLLNLQQIRIYII
jgi:hypothetical protein